MKTVSKFLPTSEVKTLNSNVGEGNYFAGQGWHPLPEVEFDLSGKGSATTNNWSRFYLNKGMHEYSASSKHANQVVNLKFTSSLVIVMDENFREIVRHRRVYGDTK